MQDMYPVPRGSPKPRSGVRQIPCLDINTISASHTTETTTLAEFSLIIGKAENTVLGVERISPLSGKLTNCLICQGCPLDGQPWLSSSVIGIC